MNVFSALTDPNDELVTLVLRAPKFAWLNASSASARICNFLSPQFYISQHRDIRGVHSVVSNAGIVERTPPHIVRRLSGLAGSTLG